jgi:transaldolase
MPESNPLHHLHPLGQSVWLDYIRREILENGELEAMIARYDLRGVTSNPSIFEEAIGKSDDYDSAMEELAADGADASRAYETLAVQDIQRACDFFRSVYDAAGGHDGFVSLEVSPELAHSAEDTLEEARRLWKAVGRPNLMVKVPGTEHSVPAFEQLIAEGINVNVTLLFSISGYERVMEAYLRGLEKRAEQGGALDRVASVASFFVSRVDSAVDAALEKLGTPEARALMGKAAVANAKLASLDKSASTLLSYFSFLFILFLFSLYPSSSHTPFLPTPLPPPPYPSPYHTYSSITFPPLPPPSSLPFPSNSSPSYSLFPYSSFSPHSLQLFPSSHFHSIPSTPSPLSSSFYSLTTHT